MFEICAILQSSAQWVSEALCTLYTFRGFFVIFLEKNIPVLRNYVKWVWQ